MSIKHIADLKLLIESLYVDDSIFTENVSKLFEEFKNSMMKEFSMIDLGKMKYFLGIEVQQGNEGIFICQNKYVLEVIQRFEMEDSNMVCGSIVPGSKLSKEVKGDLVDATRYKQLVGSLMYLTTTPLDLMFVVSSIRRYMEKPAETHMAKAKRIIRNLKGTADFGLRTGRK